MMISHHLLPLAATALLGLCVASSPQESVLSGQAQATQPTTRPAGLPTAWQGQWRGDVEVLVPGGAVAGSFEMVLEISPAPDQPAGGLPVYTWAITYEQGENRQTRPYLLRVATDETGAVLPGHFVLDERNGILVDQFLVGETMQGHFVVSSGGSEQILHARYELVTDEAGKPAIDVEIASYDGNESRRSTVNQGGVESRRLVRVQKGLLAKQE